MQIAVNNGVQANDWRMTRSLSGELGVSVELGPCCTDQLFGSQQPGTAAIEAIEEGGVNKISALSIEYSRYVIACIYLEIF